MQAFQPQQGILLFLFFSITRHYNSFLMCAYAWPLCQGNKWAIVTPFHGTGLKDRKRQPMHKWQYIDEEAFLLCSKTANDKRWRRHRSVYLDGNKKLTLKEEVANSTRILNSGKQTPSLHIIIQLERLPFSKALHVSVCSVCSGFLLVLYTPCSKCLNKLADGLANRK